MKAPTDPAALRAAQKRFARFFEELRTIFLERDDVLLQIALALLGREHILLTGPPGTAKSLLAKAVIGRIVDETTGEPSLFSKQLTESTVQTDLIGPVDFKVLTETGRTEHFTDEGMLGAIHAHLDEVLDGRDMLLRTTLNVLHERELKQGTKVTSGQIECAIMTSNRYLAEVMETSRENLLAFVDRIAFLAFVPKGFANPDHLTAVLSGELEGRAKPRARLTIQDLDVLQAAVDRVHVPRPLLAHLGKMLHRIEEEVEAARRADPTFVPTRYLSTRTAVRLARLLRSICVYRRATESNDRALKVRPDDFALLRTGVVLNGPAPEEIEALLALERDGRERRQLSIMQIEREIFDRVFIDMPPPGVRGDKQVRVDEDTLETATDEDLAALASTAAHGAEEAAEKLRERVLELERSARVHGAMSALGTEDSAAVVLEKLQGLADEVDALSERQPLARWVRGRALDLLGRVAELRVDEMVVAQRRPARGQVDADQRCVEILEAMSQLRELERDLVSAGAEPSAELEERFRRGLGRAEAELIQLYDEALAEEAAATIHESAPDSDLGTLLRTLRPALEAVASADERLRALGAARPGVKREVSGRRLLPLVRAGFARIDAGDREETVEAVRELLRLLERSDLLDVVPEVELLARASEAFLRAERPLEGAPTADLGGYRALRAAEQRSPLGLSLLDVGAGLPGEETPDSIGRVAEDIHSFEPPLRDRLSSADLERTERAVAQLESWWRRVSYPEAASSAESHDLEGAEAFLGVAFSEGALLRYGLETRLLSDLYPERVNDALTLRQRVRALHDQASDWIRDARRTRVEARWAELLGSGESGAAEPAASDADEA